MAVDAAQEARDRRKKAEEERKARRAAAIAARRAAEQQQHQQMQRQAREDVGLVPRPQVQGPPAPTQAGYRPSVANPMDERRRLWDEHQAQSAAPQPPLVPMPPHIRPPGPGSSLADRSRYESTASYLADRPVSPVPVPEVYRPGPVSEFVAQRDARRNVPDYGAIYREPPEERPLNRQALADYRDRAASSYPNPPPKPVEPFYASDFGPLIDARQRAEDAVRPMNLTKLGLKVKAANALMARDGGLREGFFDDGELQLLADEYNVVKGSDGKPILVTAGPTYRGMTREERFRFGAGEFEPESTAGEKFEADLEASFEPGGAYNRQVESGHGSFRGGDPIVWGGSNDPNRMGRELDEYRLAEITDEDGEVMPGHELEMAMLKDKLGKPYRITPEDLETEFGRAERLHGEGEGLGFGFNVLPEEVESVPGGNLLRDITYVDAPTIALAFVAGPGSVLPKGWLAKNPAMRHAIGVLLGASGFDIPFAGAGFYRGAAVGVRNMYTAGKLRAFLGLGGDELLRQFDELVMLPDGGVRDVPAVELMDGLLLEQRENGASALKIAGLKALGARWLAEIMQAQINGRKAAVEAGKEVRQGVSMTQLLKETTKRIGDFNEVNPGDWEEWADTLKRWDLESKGETAAARTVDPGSAGGRRLRELQDQQAALSKRLRAGWGSDNLKSTPDISEEERQLMRDLMKVQDEMEQIRAGKWTPPQRPVFDAEALPPGEREQLFRDSEVADDWEADDVADVDVGGFSDDALRARHGDLSDEQVLARHAELRETLTRLERRAGGIPEGDAEYDAAFDEVVDLDMEIARRRSAGDFKPGLIQYPGTYDTLDEAVEALGEIGAARRAVGGDAEHEAKMARLSEAAGLAEERADPRDLARIPEGIVGWLRPKYEQWALMERWPYLFERGDVVGTPGEMRAFLNTPDGVRWKELEEFQEAALRGSLDDFAAVVGEDDPIVGQLRRRTTDPLQDAFGEGEDAEMALARRFDDQMPPEPGSDVRPGWTAFEDLAPEMRIPRGAEEEAELAAREVELLEDQGRLMERAEAFGWDEDMSERALDIQHELGEIRARQRRVDEIVPTDWQLEGLGREGTGPFGGGMNFVGREADEAGYGEKALDHVLETEGEFPTRMGGIRGGTPRTDAERMASRDKKLAQREAVKAEARKARRQGVFAEAAARIRQEIDELVARRDALKGQSVLSEADQQELGTVEMEIGRLERLAQGKTEELRDVRADFAAVDEIAFNSRKIDPDDLGHEPVDLQAFLGRAAKKGQAGPGKGSGEAMVDLMKDFHAKTRLGVMDQLTNVVKGVFNVGVKHDPVISGIMRERDRMHRNVDRLATRVGAKVGYLVRSAFDLDEAGRVKSLGSAVLASRPGSVVPPQTIPQHGVSGVVTLPTGVNLEMRPTIADIAADLESYRLFLTEDQWKVMQEIKREMEPYSKMLRDAGLTSFERRVDIKPGGFYIHRATPKDPGKGVPSRVTGGKRPYSKHAGHPTQVAGIEEGQQYLSVEAAIEQFARDAGNDLVDKHVSDMFMGFTDEQGDFLGRTVYDRAIEVNKKLRPFMQREKRRLRQMIDGTINMKMSMKVVNGKKVYTPITANLVAFSPAELAILEEELARPGMDMDRVQKVLRGAVQRGGPNADVTDAMRRIDAMRPTWREAVERAREATQTTIAMGNMKGVEFPAEVANVANKFLVENMSLLGKGAVVPNTIDALNGLMRGLRATMDLSWTGVQGLIGMFKDPVAYAEAQKVAMRSLLDGDALGRFIVDFDKKMAAAGKRTSADWAGLGLRIGAANTEFKLGGEGLGRVTSTLETAPVVEQSNRGFGVFGDALRLELASGMDAAGIQEGKDAARVANLMTGWSEGRVGGDVGGLLFFAPRLFQSQIELLLAAARLDRPMGREAAKALVTTMGVGALLTIAANERLGNNNQNFDYLNPFDLDREVEDDFLGTGIKVPAMNPNFMRIRRGDHDFSLFGPWESLLRGVVSAANGDPSFFLRSKSSPLVGAFFDVVNNQQATGEKFTTETFIKGLMPFSVQSTWAPGADPGSVAVSIFGGKSSQTTATERLDQIALELSKDFDTGPVEWWQLSGAMQDELERTDPRVGPLLEEYQQDRRDQNNPAQATKDEYQGKKDDLVAQMNAKSDEIDWDRTSAAEVEAKLNDISDLRQQLVGTRKAYYGDEAYEDPYPDDIDRATAAWWGAYDEVARDPKTGAILDWEQLDELQEEALSILDAGERAVVQQDLRDDLTEVELKRIEARDAVEARPSRFAGMTRPQSQTFDQFLRDVAARADFLRDKDLPGFDGVSIREKTIAEFIAEKTGDEWLFRRYEEFAPGLADGTHEPPAAYVSWSTKNQKELEPFFPWLWDSTWEKLAAGGEPRLELEGYPRSVPSRPQRPSPREVRRDQTLREEEWKLLEQFDEEERLYGGGD